MDERRLGPVVGLGTWNTFGSDACLAQAVVDAALDAGCRVFDSSPMYSGAEASLATALAGRRDRAAMATKIWTGSVEEGRVQYRRQREWFGGVEIEQIHNLVAWEQHLEWLEYERAARRFDTVQVPLNPHERECEREILPLAVELGIAVIVMRPLGEGALLRRSVSQDALAQLGVASWAAALLKWALSDERVDLLIPGTRNPDHVSENAAAGDPPWLDADQRRLVERLAA